jgi:hypothetical protein
LQREFAAGNAFGLRHMRPGRESGGGGGSAAESSLARKPGLVYPRAPRNPGASVLAATTKPINWTNALTLLSVAILVGTELVGAGAAAGWAIGGLFGLGELITHALEGLFVLSALTGLYYFLRAALAHEPIWG